MQSAANLQMAIYRIFRILSTVDLFLLWKLTAGKCIQLPTYANNPPPLLFSSTHLGHHLQSLLITFHIDRMCRQQRAKLGFKNHPE